MVNGKDKILIEIAAYRDPDLVNTISSALIQANNPDRISFSICYQGDDLRDYNLLKKFNHCKIKHLKDSETKGPCYARYLCQQMLDDENYVFQIDSHMRFVKHWDDKMITQLLSLNDKKATISFYPTNLINDMESVPVNDEVFDYPTLSNVNIAKCFHERGSYFISFNSIPHNNKDRLARSPFISAGNFFSFADAHREVLHDPEMCWYGDELPMSIRYYTYGWNNYCPTECYIYHKYLRKNRFIPKSYSMGKEREEKRLIQLLNLNHEDYDMGKFGLGKQRTLKQFEEYAGIDFSKKLILKKNKTGWFTHG